MPAVEPGVLIDSDDSNETGRVAVRAIHEVADLTAAAALLNQIWGMPHGTSVISTGVLRAWSFTGNYVAAAYLGDEMVGVSTGFLGAGSDGAGRMLHSHVTGVKSGLRGRRVGSLLKRHQYGWAREQGISEITWTFDPAIRRNAHFNLLRLAAAPVAYLKDFYGRLDDELNAGGPSDRLLVSWRVGESGRTGAVDPAIPESDTGSDEAFRLLENRAGRPVLHASGAAPLRQVVALPDDIEALRTSDPELALQWRLALRAALGEQSGYRIAGLTPEDEFVLVRHD
ncbi:MAG: GNAT family N-acetyltransferase [Microbacterium sp.]